MKRTKDYVMLSKRDIGLLLNSEVSKLYPWIGAFLEGKKQAKISRGDDLFDQFYYNIPEIMYKAKNEWEILNEVGEDKGKESECELCGQKHLKDLFKIRNKNSGRHLIVGSTCISSFDIASKGELSNLLEERRTAKIVNLFPDIKWYVYSGKEWLERTPIIIPQYKREKFSEWINDLKSRYYDYIKSGSVEAENQIDNIYEKCKQEKILLEQYILNNKNSRLINREIYNELLRQWNPYYSPAMEEIRIKGDVTEKNYPGVPIPSFMDKIMAKTRGYSDAINLRDISVSRQKKGYYIGKFDFRRNNIRDVKIYIPHCDFWFCIIHNNEVTKNIFESVVLPNCIIHEDSYTKILSHFEKFSIRDMILQTYESFHFAPYEECVIKIGKKFGIMTERKLINILSTYIIKQKEDEYIYREIERALKNNLHTKKELMDELELRKLSS